MRWYRSTARLAPGEDPIHVTRGDRQMKSMTALVGAATLAIGFAAGALLAQPPQQGPQPFSVGNRLGLPVTPAADGAFDAISSNVKVYGAIYSAESCSYDPGRGVIVVPNRGVPQNVQTNNAWVSFINHDGSVNTARWLGIQNPARSSQPDAAARVERAVRQRHRQQHAVRRRPRWRHDPDRHECRRGAPLQPADGCARRRNARRKVDVVQRHRGGRRRDGVRDTDRRRR